MIRVSLCALALVAASCGGDSPKQLLPIGSPCASSDQCGTSPPFFCAKLDHPNGYCKRDCTTDVDCPSEAVCVIDGGVGECHKRCDTASDCRASEGYECKPASPPDSTHAYCDAPEPATGDMSTPLDGGQGG